MTNRADHTGKKFNKWTAIEYIGDAKWRCQCDCGTFGEINTANLTRGLSKSCGCAKADLLRDYWKDVPKTWTKEREKEYNDQYRLQNAEKLKVKNKLYREANKEEVSAGKKRCYEAKKEEYKSRIKANYHADPEKKIEYQKLYATKNHEKVTKYFKKWVADNHGVISANRVRRRTGRQNATPLWADLKAIGFIYNESKRLTEETGVKHNVDHIIPLRGKLVCGLHCENNLRIITETENKRKGKMFVEDLLKVKSYSVGGSLEW